MSRGGKHRKRRKPWRHRTLPGAPPGILVPDEGAPRPTVTVMAYGPDGCVEAPAGDLRHLREHVAKWPVTWVNVDGLGDTTVISEIGALFGFHKLALEDVVHVHQRAKVEQYEAHTFIVARMPLASAGGATEQIGIFLGDRFVVTFQEHAGGDCLEPVRVRIRSGIGQIRTKGPDALAYAILDSIIDHFFPIVEVAGDRLDELEDEILRLGDRGVVSQLHAVKRSLLAVRRAVWPLRDALNAIIRDESSRFTTETKVFLRDCYDHTVQIIDLLENYREIGAGLHDLYLSMISNRTNDIMRVLTVFSTIFIPLTFIVGVYGMNFDRDASPWSMPELGWYWGYPLVMILMAAFAGVLLLYFVRKGWFGAGDLKALRERFQQGRDSDAAEASTTASVDPPSRPSRTPASQ